MELVYGTVISECTAITEYLDSAFGERTLTGTTPKERAVIHMMQRCAESRLLDTMGAYFHHATLGLGPDIEGEQCSKWGEMQRGNAVLADQPHIAGEAFTMADITVIAGLDFADFAENDIPADCTNLMAWRTRVSKRPSIAGQREPI